VGLNLFVKRSLMHSLCLCVLLLIFTCACACVFEEVIYYTAAGGFEFVCQAQSHALIVYMCSFVDTYVCMCVCF